MRSGRQGLAQSGADHHATAALTNHRFAGKTRAMRDSVRALLPHEFRKAAVELYTDGREASG